MDNGRLKLPALEAGAFKLQSFTFKGEHIFYRSRRSTLRPGTGDPILRLIEEPGKLDRWTLEKIKFSDSKLEEVDDFIYIGNNLLPEMLESFNINGNDTSTEKVPSVEELYNFLKNNIKGLERKEKRTESYIKRQRLKF